MADFLLEIFSEEIPARMQIGAMSHLVQTLETGLNAKVTAQFSTPRRLAVMIKDLPAKQPDVTHEIKGPKMGAPEAALTGFLKKTGLTQDKLEERDGVYFAITHEQGKATAEVIKNFVEDILKNFPWPKSMRWGAGDTTWVRPLHSILCLFDGKVVPVEFAGVNAGDKTYGHRFMSPDEITIKKPADYEAALAKAFVIADREKRKAKIVKQLDANCKALKVILHEDSGLLEEVTGLVEWPLVLDGKIDEAFMDLPHEVLILEMRNHQKYFATKGSDGKLAPYFMITANMETSDGGKAIVAGNERVLRARFSDGRFFWDQDRKTPLTQFAERLKSVTYHASLGSIADKMRRVSKLASSLADYVDGADKAQVERAVTLAKADLVSGMVGEFAELQGTMGRYYALQQNEPEAVADAIRDHYKPQGPGDAVPIAPVSVCVALADKLDTLVCLFAIGEKPTGSKDPYALRRAALGVIRIILENKIRIPLVNAFAFIPAKEIALHKAHEKLVKQTEAKLRDPAFAAHKVGKYLTINETASEDIPEDAARNLVVSLLGFFHDRLIVQLKDQGIRHDVIKAVVASGDDDLVRIVEQAKALQSFLSSEDGANLLAGYKRAANILAIEEKKDSTSYDAARLDESALQETAEKALASTLSEVKSKLEPLMASESYEEAMTLLAGLREPVDQFFEKIMVNCDNKELRNHRLRLLASIRDGMNALADFSLIEG